MSYFIRPAVISDAPAIYNIKNTLSYSNPVCEQDGFLLGTEVKTYEDYINSAYCLVACYDNTILGFGIVLGNSLLRQSQLWQRRHQASWVIDLSKYESKCLAYFEQLAFLKKHRNLAVLLVYRLVKLAFESGAEYMFTTTVLEPFVNKAAHRFIFAVKGQYAGSIQETYASIGQIKSAIYLIDARYFYSETEKMGLNNLSRQHI